MGAASTRPSLRPLNCRGRCQQQLGREMRRESAEVCRKSKRGGILKTDFERSPRAGGDNLRVAQVKNIFKSVIASEAKQSSLSFRNSWIASRSLSSGGATRRPGGSQ